MRALLLILAAAVVAVPAALAGPKDPTKQHTAADTKTATSLALKRADFQAGWKQEKSSSNSGPDCTAQPDESKLIETADVDPTFDSPNGGAVTVDSEVTLFKTKAMALADWRTGRLALLKTCLGELLSKALGKRATVTVAQQASVPAKAERTLGFHFEVKAKGIALTVDLMGLGRGRTTVLLTAIGAKGSYQRAALNPLAAVLARRLAQA